MNESLHPALNSTCRCDYIRIAYCVRKFTRTFFVLKILQWHVCSVCNSKKVNTDLLLIFPWDFWFLLLWYCSQNLWQKSLFHSNSNENVETWNKLSFISYSVTSHAKAMKDKTRISRLTSSALYISRLTSLMTSQWPSWSRNVCCGARYDQDGINTFRWQGDSSSFCPWVSGDKSYLI